MTGYFNYRLLIRDICRETDGRPVHTVVSTALHKKNPTFLTVLLLYMGRIGEQLLTELIQHLWRKVRDMDSGITVVFIHKILLQKIKLRQL